MNRTRSFTMLLALLLGAASACGVEPASEPGGSAAVAGLGGGFTGSGGMAASGTGGTAGGTGGGAVSCPAPYLSCAGGCVNPSVDVLNCGQCGVTCGAGALCVAGQCACTGALIRCGAACVDLAGSGEHCGACDSACVGGLVCSSGTCQATCADSSRIQCGSSCVDTASDPLHCGSCGAACTGGVCLDGACACSTGLTLCGDRCVDLARDAANCGACANVCPSGTCENGVCVAGSGTGGSGGSGATGGGGVATRICATADEDSSATLTCPAGQVIDAIVFASYGTPAGDCGAFAEGSCHSASSSAVVEAQCQGRASCVVPATNGYFGDPCNSTVKRLAVEVACVEGQAGSGGTSTGGTGGGAPFKGVANSSCPARKALKVSWYYNWMQRENEPCSDGGGGEFVPMIWGHAGAEQTAPDITSSVSTFVAQGYTSLLAFNEPDNPTQSNIPVATAIALMPAFDNPAIRIGSPATAANANPGQAWFSSYMTELNANPALRNDFLAIHWYGWNAGSCDANAAQLESYIRWVEGFAGNRPIWITEWGCLNQSAPDMATVVSFYRGALAVFARHPRIERYAWYPWATNCGLVNDDGTLTALGQAYAEAPEYR